MPNSLNMAALGAPAPVPPAATDRSGPRQARARRLAVAVFLVLVLATWKLASTNLPAIVLPSPERVGEKFIALWTDPVFLSFAAVSLFHVVAALLIAFVLGVAIALLGHRYGVLDLAINNRLAPFLNAFSTVGWAFLALIWFGITHQAVVFAAVVSLVPIAVINASAGLRELNGEMIEMSRSFTRSTWRQTAFVVLPLLFPYLFSTLRLCFGISWQAVLVVELLCGSGGLGYLISSARARYATDSVFAIAFLVFLVVFVIDRLVFARVQRWLGSTYAA